MTGSYSHKFSCKANGYKILFFKGRSYLVKDEESIKQLMEDPFYQEVGATPKPAKPSKSSKRTTGKRVPKLSEAVKSGRK